MSLIAQVFLKLLTPKMRLLKRIKGLVSENPSAENLLKNILYFTAPISKIFPKKIHSEKLSYVFSKKGFCYILGNGTFLYFI